MASIKLRIPVLTSLTLTALGATALACAADPPPPQIPTCDKKIGTLAVTEPENKWWLQYNLDSPEALIKVFVVAVEVLHAARSRQGPGGRREGARARGRRRDARRLEHRQGPDEGRRLRAGAGHREQERQFRRQASIGGMLGGMLRRRRRRGGGRHQPEEQDRRRGADADRRALHRAGGARAGPRQEDRPRLGRGRRRASSAASPPRAPAATPTPRSARS